MVEQEKDDTVDVELVVLLDSVELDSCVELDDTVVLEVVTLPLVELELVTVDETVLEADVVGG